MRKIPRTCLAPEDLAVIAYHEDNGDLFLIWTRARYTLCVPLYYRLRSRVYHAASPAASNLFPQQ